MIALIVIDMAEEQLSSNGVPRFKHWKGVDNILKLSKCLPPSQVIDCRLWLSDTDNSTLPSVFPDVGKENTVGAELATSLKSINATFVKKVNYSCFFNTELHKMLQELKATHLVLCGINTDYCVFATALDAFYLGYHVFIVQDACTSISGPAGHKRGVTDVLRFLGNNAQVLQTEQACRLLTTGDVKVVERVPTGECDMYF